MFPLFLYFIFTEIQLVGSTQTIYTATQPVILYGLPVQIIIPKIHTDTFVEHVGLTDTKTVGIPLDPFNVAWFTGGVRPGEVGVALINGHYGWLQNIPVAFDNLHKLRSGDKVYIKDTLGVTIVFIVRTITEYDSYETTEKLLSSKDNKAHLVLITCSGSWDKENKNYSKRLIVFTDKE